MPPLPRLDHEAVERFESAAANLKRILRELEPYEHKAKVEELSTAGTWRSPEDVQPLVAISE
jgi:hypothetical protein